MIPRVHLSELWKLTMRRSTLITIPNLIEFFNFNNEFGQWEVFYQICRDALDKFELYYPMYRVQKQYIKVDEHKRMATVTDTFEGYLKGSVDEDYLFIKPASVIGLSLNSTVGSIYPLRDYKFEDGTFTDFWYSSNIYWMACLCHRPFLEDFDEKGDPKENCAIFFVEKDKGPRWKYLKDQIYVELCRYLWNMRQNMQLQNLPIDIFQGLQEDSQRVQSDLDRVYEQALNSSAWLM